MKKFLETVFMGIWKDLMVLFLSFFGVIFCLFGVFALVAVGEFMGWYVIPISHQSVEQSLASAVSALIKGSISMFLGYQSLSYAKFFRSIS